MQYIDYYNQYKDKIFSYFYYNLSQNRELAEDLSSDTFLKAFEKFNTYNDDFAFSTWIYTIAKRTLINHYKKQKIHIDLEEMNESSLQEFASYEENFWKNVDDKEELKAFYEALEKLNPAEKEVIIWKYIQEYSTKEIAENSGKSEANVRKILSRWMWKIKKMLWKT